MTWPPVKREPGELYVQAQGRTVEILAVDEVADSEYDSAVEVLAYKFVGGSMVHLRSVASTENWQQVVSG